MPKRIIILIVIMSFFLTGVGKPILYQSSHIYGNSVKKSDINNNQTSLHNEPDVNSSVVFQEDFSGDLSQWTLYGSPTPFIDMSYGNPAPSFQINGDGYHPNVALSTVGITPEPGMVITFDLQISHITALHHGSGLGLSREWYAREDYQNWQRLGVLGSDGTGISYECGSQPIEDTDFHSFKFIVQNDYRLEAYMDDMTTPKCITDFTVSPDEFNNIPILIGGREGHVDNVIVTSPNGPQTILISEINEMIETDPSSIEGEEVVVRAMPMQTHDWTFGVGEALNSKIGEMGKGAYHAYKITKYLIFAAKTIAFIPMILKWMILEVVESMQMQILLGTDINEGRNPVIFIWYPGGTSKFLDLGRPYYITGTVKHYLENEDRFYYIDIENATPDDPSPTNPNFPMPADHTFYTVRELSEMTFLSTEDVFTVGWVIERWKYNGDSYVAFDRTFRTGDSPSDTKAVIVRLIDNDEAPICGSILTVAGSTHVGTVDNDGWNDHQLYIKASDITPIQDPSVNSPITEHEYCAGKGATFHSGSPIDIHLYDDLGNHTGAVYDNSGTVIEIEENVPGSTYIFTEGDSGEIVILSGAESFNYDVQYRGTAEGTYDFGYTTYDNHGSVVESEGEEDVPTSKDQVDEFSIDVPPFIRYIFLPGIYRD